MASRHRLSDLERLEIVRETQKGVSTQVLAKRFGVTPRTIQYTVRREKTRKRDSGIRTVQIGTTITPEELRAFEAVLSRHGVSSRSEAMRRLIQSANEIFQPDEYLADELRGFRAALNRVGNNVTQIAKRMNEANNKGIKPPFGRASLTQMRSLAGFVLDFADQVDLLVRRRTNGIKLSVNEALRELVDGEE
ncbi:MAG: helix-turn-helix domain-containing protein [Pelagimonas sp.]|uniref:helix-turn-helix domain-containing protein n=1 Tax=Pelagimonas sp. TaxID=2073170 RepID=UPI003D6BEABC